MSKANNEPTEGMVDVYGTGWYASGLMRGSLSSATPGQLQGHPTQPQPSPPPPATPAIPSWRLPQRFKLANCRLLTSQQMAAAHEAVSRQHCKSWYLARGRMPPVPPLNPVIRQLIWDWFSAVDEDGSGTLEHHELMSALKAAHIPCDDQTINEMIDLMDMNRDGVIGWDEFLNFMACEFHNGKSLTAGEWMMPSGTALNFGIMIGKLKRDKLMKEVLESEQMRSRWVTVASDPDKLAKEVATLSEAAQVAAEMTGALQAGPTNARARSNTAQGMAAEGLLHTLALESRLSRPASQHVAAPHPHLRGMADLLAGGTREGTREGARDSSTGSISPAEQLGYSRVRTSTSRLGLVPTPAPHSRRPSEDNVWRAKQDGYCSAPASPPPGAIPQRVAAAGRRNGRASLDEQRVQPSMYSILRRINSPDPRSSPGASQTGLADDASDWHHVKQALPVRRSLDRPTVQGSLATRSSLPLSTRPSGNGPRPGTLRTEITQIDASMRGNSDTGSVVPLLPLHRLHHNTSGNSRGLGLSAAKPQGDGGRQSQE